MVQSGSRRYQSELLRRVQQRSVFVDAEMLPETGGCVVLRRFESHYVSVSGRMLGMCGNTWGSRHSRQLWNRFIRGAYGYATEANSRWIGLVFVRHYGYSWFH